jgi:hypothetical protein
VPATPSSAGPRLDVDLVPVLEHKARPQYLRDDFETAAFVAMKEVEVQVRSRAGRSDSLVGTKLMQEAFKAAGPLWHSDVDPGESVALMELLQGSDRPVQERCHRGRRDRAPR